MIYYAVIDTNVLVSAMLKEHSNPWHITDKMFHGNIVPLVNGKILNEYVDVLSRPKFKFPISKIDKMLSDIIQNAIFVDTDNIEELKEILPDPKDVVFYEVVMEARKEHDAYLVTGNIKHFPFKTFIVTPREMLDIINQSNESE